MNIQLLVHLQVTDDISYPHLTQRVAQTLREIANPVREDQGVLTVNSVKLVDPVPSDAPDEEIVVDRWLRCSDQLATGLDMDGDAETSGPDGTLSSQIIAVAAGCMDSACTWEIVGDCVFLATDGKYYCGTVAFRIAEANPDYITDLLEEEPDS